MMKRKVALDVGDVRIGVAVSDVMGICANPRETYVRKGSAEEDALYFAQYAQKEDADAFVVGLPKIWTGRRVRGRRSRGNSANCWKGRAGSP